VDIQEEWAELRNSSSGNDGRLYKEQLAKYKKPDHIIDSLSPVALVDLLIVQTVNTIAGCGTVIFLVAVFASSHHFLPTHPFMHSGSLLRLVPSVALTYFFWNGI